MTQQRTRGQWWQTWALAGMQSVTNHLNLQHLFFIDLKFPPCASSPWKAFCEGVCVLGEKLFAVGGYDGSGYLSLVEAYDSRLEDLGWSLQVKILWDEQLFPQRELLEGSGVVEYWTRRSLCRCCAKVASRYLMMMMIDFKNTIRYEGSTALYTVYTVYTVYYSNCFTLLKQQHSCLYIS